MTKEQTEMHAAVIKLIANLAQRTESHAAQFESEHWHQSGVRDCSVAEGIVGLGSHPPPFIPFAGPLCTTRRWHDCCLPR